MSTETNKNAEMYTIPTVLFTPDFWAWAHGIDGEPADIIFYSKDGQRHEIPAHIVRSSDTVQVPFLPVGFGVNHWVDPYTSTSAFHSDGNEYMITRYPILVRNYRVETRIVVDGETVSVPAFHRVEPRAVVEGVVVSVPATQLLSDSPYGVVNMTPHDMTVFGLDGSYVVPASGYVTRNEAEYVHDGYLGSTPQYLIKQGAPYGVPAEQDGVIYIVSAQVLNHPALAHRKDLRAIGPAVRDSKGRVVAGVGLVMK